MITSEDSRCNATRKRHKYGAIPTTVDGIRFASKAEARRYGELKLLEKAGEICDLVLQPSYTLQNAYTHLTEGKQRELRYVADFEYVEKGAPTVYVCSGVTERQRTVEDVKGMATPVFKLKRKLFLYKYPHLTLRVIK